MAKMTPANIARVKELVARGTPITWIAMWLKVSRQAIYYHLNPRFRENELQRRKQYRDYRKTPEQVQAEYDEGMDMRTERWR